MGPGPPGPGIVLGQAFPSPFHSVTTIPFSLPAAGRATLEIFDTGGRRVANLADREFSAGHNALRWDASAAPAGVYHYRLRIHGVERAGRVVLAR